MSFDLFSNMSPLPFGDVVVPPEYRCEPTADTEWTVDMVANAEYVEIAKGNLYVAGLHALWMIHNEYGHWTEARALTDMIVADDFKPLLSAANVVLLHHARMTYVGCNADAIGSDTFRRCCRRPDGGNLIIQCYIHCFQPIDPRAVDLAARRGCKRDVDSVY